MMWGGADLGYAENPVLNALEYDIHSLQGVKDKPKDKLPRGHGGRNASSQPATASRSMVEDEDFTEDMPRTRRRSATQVDTVEIRALLR